MYRLAQAERLKRYCDQYRIDFTAVLVGELTPDLTAIKDEHGQILPELIDLESVERPGTPGQLL